MTFTNDTWDNILTNGAGKFDLRLEIEGFEHDFVTSEWLTGPTGSFGKTRIGGLQRDGIKISYRTSLADRTLDAGGMNFKIQDTDGRASKALNFTPSKYAILAASISETDTTINVYTDYDWGPNEVVYLGKEAINVQSFNSTTGDFNSCTRGVLDSVAHAYTVTNIEQETLAVRIRDKPLTLDGRRVRVFAYGEDNDPTGAGTIVWRGRLKRDFEYRDGGLWEAGAVGISEMFKENVGQSIGETKLRGFWFPRDYIHFRVLAKLQSWEVPSTEHTRINIDVFGFYETLQDLVDELDRQLQNWIGSEPNWETTFNASSANFEILPNGALGIRFETQSTGTLAYIILENWQMNINRFPYYAYHNVQPADDSARLVDDMQVLPIPWLSFETSRFSGPDGAGTEAFTYYFDAAGEFTQVPMETAGGRENSQPADSDGGATVDTTYYFSAAGPAPAAACMVLGWPEVGAGFPTIPDNARNRIYYDNEDITEAFETIIDFNVISNDINHSMVNPSIRSAPANYTTAWPVASDGTIDPGQWIGSESFLPTFNGLDIYLTDETEFKIGLSITRNGHVKDFLSDLASLSVTDGRYLLPDITSADIDVDDMDAEYARVTISDFISNVNFSYFKGDTKIEEIIEPELFLSGLIPTVATGSQKFSFRRLAGVSRFVPVEATINVSNTLRNEWPILQRLREHMVSGLIVKTGWDPVEDEYLGGDQTAIDQAAKVEYRTDNITIERKATETEYSDIDVREILFRNLSALSIPYYHTTLTCPMTKKVFNLVPGSVVRITTPHLPDPADGNRGITDQAGLILGIEKDFATGQCTIEVYFVTDRFGGYTPTAKVASSNQLSGLTYEIVVAGAGPRNYAPPRSITPDGGWFTVGDEVRFEEWNSWQPVTASGEITAISQDVVNYTFTVEFDDTPAAATINNTARMRFADYPTALNSLNEIQSTWTYVGDETDPEAVVITLFDI